MESNPQVCYENPYQQARKAAAKYNDGLSSQAGAAELLGCSVSTVSDYELGLTTPPPDKVFKMAQLYNAPELKRRYCKTECPIGRDMPVTGQVKSIEQAAIKLALFFSSQGIDIEAISTDFLDIASDGIITEDEETRALKGIELLKDMEKVIDDLCVTCEKALQRLREE